MNTVWEHDVNIKKTTCYISRFIKFNLILWRGGKMWNELWFFVKSMLPFPQKLNIKKKKRIGNISMINNISIPFFFLIFLPLYRLYCLRLDYVIVNAGRQSIHRSGTKNDYPVWVKFIVLFKNNLFAMQDTSYTL